MNKLHLTVAICISMLAACGGGGGGGDGGTTPVQVTQPTVSTAPFHVNLAMSRLIADGYVAPVTMSGVVNGIPVTGNGTVTAYQPAPATFEGSTARDAVTVVNISVTANGVTTAASPTSTHDYFNSTGEFLGELGSSYSVAAPRFSFPFTVRVGDNGSLGTTTVYQDSTKSSIKGYEEHSYSIEPDTADTAIFNWKTATTNASRTPTDTTEQRFRITVAGAATMVSTTGTFTGSSAGNLTITPTSFQTPGPAPATAAASIAASVVQ